MGDTTLVTAELHVAITSHSAPESYGPALLPLQLERETTNGQRMEQDLAPTDGGPAAWRLLCAAFMFEALLWGEIIIRTAFGRRG